MTLIPDFPVDSEDDPTPPQKPISKPPKTQADVDHSALIEHGKRLTGIEERLGRMEEMLLVLVERGKG